MGLVYIILAITKCSLRKPNRVEVGVRFDNKTFIHFDDLMVIKCIYFYYSRCESTMRSINPVCHAPTKNKPRHKPLPLLCRKWGSSQRIAAYHYERKTFLTCEIKEGWRRNI